MCLHTPGVSPRLPHQPPSALTRTAEPPTATRGLLQAAIPQVLHSSTGHQPPVGASRPPLCWDWWEPDSWRPRRSGRQTIPTGRSWFQRNSGHTLLSPSQPRPTRMLTSPMEQRRSELRVTLVTRFFPGWRKREQRWISPFPICLSNAGLAHHSHRQRRSRWPQEPSDLPELGARWHFHPIFRLAGNLFLHAGLIQMVAHR